MKVSVLMSVYNGSEYLQESIDSILNQTFTDFEFIIIDDCSTDNTEAILQQNADRDQRVVLVKNSENLGLIKSLNKGLAIAQGDYIARQDADDISLPHRLEQEVAILDQQPDCVLVSCNLQVIQDSGTKIVEVMDRVCASELVSWYLLFYNHIGGHSQVMYRRSHALKLGGYSEAWLYVEDYEFWCRFARTKQKLVILPETLLTYRRHGKSVSAQKAGEQEINVIRQVQSNLSQLTGKEITTEETKVLIGFWKGTLKIASRDAHHRFPDGSKAEFIHLRSLEIKQSFVQEYAPFFGADLDKQIHRAISGQFLAWLQSPLTSHHSIWSKVQISQYALRWNPLNVPIGWFIWLLRLPFDTVTSVFRKLRGLFQASQNLRVEFD